MSEISILPSPVAAELLGNGSFFGACQVASSNFGDFLAEAQTGNFSDFEAAIAGYANENNDNEVLKQLQEILGEKEGAEAFETIKKFIRNNDSSEKKIGEESEFFEKMQTLFNLLRNETPTEDLKTMLEVCIKEINELLGIEPTIEPEIEQAIEPTVEQTISAQAEPEELPEQAEAEPVSIIDPENMRDIRIKFAAEYLGIEPEDQGAFVEFINDLVKKGLITMQDLGEVNTYQKDENSLVIVERVHMLDFFKTTLENLWASVKAGDEPKKEELLAMLKQVVDTKEVTKELKEALGVEQPAQSAQSAQSAQQTRQHAHTTHNANAAQAAQPAQQAQPEIRAAWEGGVLKVEVVDAKTGEKLQSAPASSNMQERMHEFEVIRQVIAKAKFITTPTGEQRITMQLRPEHLGQLDLRIVLNRGEMQIYAKVESATAQHALENNIGLLREGLEKQGINLDRLEISIEQRDRQDAWSLAQERREQKHSHHRHNRHGRETHLAVSVRNDANADTGRRLGYNTMEYLA
ncbi:MAG: flagellar hook-length control protein FliK [Fibromonadales bacterium]|nr:flagellar hook-length control protein FliK [Fibromonadales bacterium]